MVLVLRHSIENRSNKWHVVLSFTAVVDIKPKAVLPCSFQMKGRKESKEIPGCR